VVDVGGTAVDVTVAGGLVGVGGTVVGAGDGVGVDVDVQAATRAAARMNTTI
jgi:hypothetical protein